MEMRSQRCLEMEQPIHAKLAKSAANPATARVGGVRSERRLAVGVAKNKKQNKQQQQQQKVISPHYA